MYKNTFTAKEDLEPCLTYIQPLPFKIVPSSAWKRSIPRQDRQLQ